jgi:hypothetical protein
VTLGFPEQCWSLPGSGCGGLKWSVRRFLVFFSDPQNFKLIVIFCSMTTKGSEMKQVISQIRNVGSRQGAPGPELPTH